MANNIFANQANGVVARQDIAADTLFNVGDILIAYEIGASFLSWVPGRGINSFDTFKKDKAYYIIGGNTSIDRELYFAPRVAVLPAGSFRFATGADIIANPQMKPGDYVIDGNNVPDGGITDFPPQMAAGSTIFVKGGNYAYLFLDCTNTNGTLGNPVKITNYAGQVVAPIGLTGKNVKLTGRYVAGQTGDVNFRGWDVIGTRCLSGSFGFRATIPAGYDDFLSNNIALAALSSGVEIEYVESGMGGYAGIMIKQESGTVDMNDIHIHDCYIHECDGEGIYVGSTDADPQHQFNNLNIHDNYITRNGLNGIQIGQLRDNCKIHHNTLIANTLSWARSFETFQDQATQFYLRKSGAQIYNNLVIGGGENWMNFAMRPKAGIPQDTVLTLIDNNAFLYCRNSYSLYMSFNGITAAAIKVSNNIFGKHFLNYNEVYPNAFPTNFELLAEEYNSHGITINFSSNIIDSTNTKGPTYIAKTGDATVGTDIVTTETGNVVVPAVDNPLFVNFMDFPADFNYASLEYWVGTIPPAFPTGGTLRSYKQGAYVMYRGKLYKSLHNSNSGNIPQQATNQHWQLITFSNGTTSCIPDDGRLTSTDFYALRGIGMTRNLAVVPTTTSTTTTSTSTTSTTSTSTTSTSTTSTSTTTSSTTTTTTAAPFSSNDLSIAGTDNGDNTFNIKWTVNAADFTGKAFKLVGLGSSTLSGLGATPPSDLPSLIQSWLTGVFSGSAFLNMAVGGRYTLFALPEGNNTLVDPNKNIDAAIVTGADAAFISFPSNDIYFGLTPAQFVNNLQILFNAFAANGIPCFVETTQPRDDLNATQQTALKTSAALIRSTFPAAFVVDTFDALRDTTALTDAKINPVYSAGDQIHLNGGGQSVVFNALVSKIQAYFHNPTYVLYQIERSTSPTSGFTLFDSVNTGSTISKTYNRTANTTFYYRVRAQRPDTIFTNYSNVVKIAQPISVGSPDQVIQINFAGASNPAAPSDWNTWLGTEGADTPIDTGIINLKTTSLVPTTIGAKVTKKFGSSFPGNAEVSGIYPYNVMNSSWSVRDAFLDYSQITFTGLSPANVYKLDVFTAYSSFYITGLGVRANTDKSKKNFGWGSTAPVGHAGNTNKLITVPALIPDANGNLSIDFMPLVYGVGALSALTLTRFVNANPPTTTSTTTTTSTSTTSTTSTSTTTTTSTSTTSTTSTSTTSTTTAFTGPTVGRQLIDQYKISSGGTLTYGLTWLPTGYTSSAPSFKYPLIIFLHGSGEAGSGTGGLSNLIGTGLPQKIAAGFDVHAISPLNGQDYKFIVCSPQAPNWSYSYPQLQYIIPDIISRYKVDPNMVYITGLSAGGEGTWSAVTNSDPFTEKFAAIAPVSSTDLSSAAQEAKLHDIIKIHLVKAWTICGSSDAWLSTAYKYQGLVNTDFPIPKMMVTEIPGAGHDASAWNTAYDPAWRTNGWGMNMYEYFLNFPRGPVPTTTTTSTSSTTTTSTSTTSTTSTSSTSTTSTTSTSTTSTSTTTTTTTYQQRILIDLGGDGVNDGPNPDGGIKTPDNSVGAKGQAPDGKWWNNIVDCRAGTWITTPVDINNNNVTLSIAANVTPRQSWSPDDYSINFAGIVQAVSDYPETAVRDNCYFYDFSQTTNLTFIIPGGKTASIKFWGNRDAAGPRTLKIKKSTDGSYTQEFDAAFNTTYSQGVTFTGLTGTVIFNCQVKSDSTFGHISVIDIQLT